MGSRCLNDWLRTGSTIYVGFCMLLADLFIPPSIICPCSLLGMLGHDGLKGFLCGGIFMVKLYWRY